MSTKHHQRPHHERGHNDGFNLTTLVLDFTMWGKGKLSDADAAKLGGILTVTTQCPTLEHLEVIGIRFDRR